MAAKGSIEEIERVQVDGLVSALTHLKVSDAQSTFLIHSSTFAVPLASTLSTYPDWARSLPSSRLPSCCLSQVALKIIKHCQEEGGSSELVTGFLVGLVVGKTLEITNCFPLSKDPDESEDESE